MGANRVRATQTTTPAGEGALSISRRFPERGAVVLREARSLTGHFESNHLAKGPLGARAYIGRACHKKPRVVVDAGLGRQRAPYQRRPYDGITSSSPP